MGFIGPSPLSVLYCRLLGDHSRSLGSLFPHSVVSLGKTRSATLVLPGLWKKVSSEMTSLVCLYGTSYSSPQESSHLARLWPDLCFVVSGQLNPFVGFNGSWLTKLLVPFFFLLFK